MMPTGWIDGERAVASRILLSLTTRLPRLRHRPPTLRRLLKFLQAHLVGDAIRCAIGDECKVVRGRMELASLCLFSQLLASNSLRGTSLYRGLDLVLSTLVDLHPEQSQLDVRTHQVDCKPLGVAHDNVLSFVVLHPVGRSGRVQPTPPCHSFSPLTVAPLLLARHEGDAPWV